ncbi:antibiotic biosynthesis monooxygenase family protein [Pedomonas mirosovicensis]|uniref:antibiotic biosynthesis monooxygenase family protein n=1 Tax=Pedomonas mirosovicensis TaxID=2908641 RepID=UPI00216767FD|nr:antibiotic biosynthesis monooxygenase [Pedomonas mirosovicensis]MCH8684656.1 antibiotic biosynthesis monooxygenase [Pedomonas mirosovicensis]
MTTPPLPQTPRLTPPFDPPYYAVIFASVRTPVDDGYGEMAETMVTLAAQQPGYLGHDSVRDPATGLGITVSYWRDEASIAHWRSHAQHQMARHLGREQWYETFVTHVARVERSYGFHAARKPAVPA